MTPPPGAPSDTTGTDGAEPVQPSPPDAAAFSWRPGARLPDDLVLHEQIGEGGMGIVYRASHVVTRHEFAVKRVRLALKAPGAARARLYAELVSWHELPEHPHLVACRFHRTIGGELAIFTDFMPGGTLADRLAGGQSLPPPEALRVAAQLASATAAVHDRGLVHQDIKPSNVLFDAKGSARLTDFGLARAGSVDEGAPEPAGALATWRGMTPAYSSPEQAARRRLGPSSDIYSFAVTITHALLGRLAWTRGAELAGEAAGLLAHVDAPAGLIAILDACLAADPAARPGMPRVAQALRALGAEVAEPADRVDEPSARLPEYQSRITISRRLMGSLGWKISASVDFGHDLPSAGPEPTERRARLAYEIEEMLRYADHYRAAVSTRPELTRRLQGLLCEIALAQDEAGDLEAAVHTAAEALTAGDAASREHRKTVDAALVTGRLMLKHGSRSEMIALLGPIAAAWAPDGNPFACQVIISLANAYSDLGLVAHAREWYERALAWRGPAEEAQVPGPLEGQVHHELALLHKYEGEPQAALREVELAIAPYDGEGLLMGATGLGESHHLKGTLLTDLGRHEEALVAYGRALTLFDASIGYAGDSLQAQASIARTRMSRSISLHALGRLDEAATELDSAIESRRAWYAGEGRSEFGDELARAYRHKAGVLADLGDRKGAMECRMQARALYRQVHEGGRRNVRIELAAIEGDIGERLWDAEMPTDARQFIASSTLLLEELVQDPTTADKTRREVRTTLVTRYYQLSRLAQEQTRKEAEGPTRAALLDLTLRAAAALLHDSAAPEALARYIDASADKALLLHEQQDDAGAERTFEAAFRAYKATVDARGADVTTHAPLQALLRCGGLCGLVVQEQAPRRALALIDDSLGAAAGVVHGPVDLLDQLAHTWLARARICRVAEPDQVARSAEQAFDAWRRALAVADRLGFLSRAIYYASDHVDWSHQAGNTGVAHAGAVAMHEILRDAAHRTGRRDAAEAAASWQERYASLLAAPTVATSLASRLSKLLHGRR